MKYNRIFVLWMLVIAVFLAGCNNGEVRMTVKEDAVLEHADKEDIPNTAEAAENFESNQEVAEADCIYVYVCGHVLSPGVYALDKQARICDALALAGGISEDGCGESLNQAEHMTDGQTLYVPGIDEVQISAGMAETLNGVDDGKVNINTASKEELMSLSGIGESKADMIIQYREEHGSFESIESLMEIPGIKEGVYNKIKSEIKV
ncbi:MAG: helix-hairpin-helix domain-containing protein [Clostridiales bacterium]|nr:helix-hairpin-helix domain-containing protein [Clostridiales bacterium]